MPRRRSKTFAWGWTEGVLAFLILAQIGILVVDRWVARWKQETAALLAAEAVREHTPVESPVVPPPEQVAPKPESSARPAEAEPLLGEAWTAATLDHLLARHAGLALDFEEKARLREVYLYWQNVRTTYEADIAEVVSISPTLAQIRIPPYPEAGARLQQLWMEELEAEMGSGRAGQLEEELGDVFHVAFKAFGAGAQVLEVQLTSNAAREFLYRISARLDFADVSQPELGFDDSRLFSTTAYYQLKPETVATGEWRPLARHFPRLPE